MRLSAPSAIRPSMTPVEHAARATRAALSVGALVSASAARTRARASVMRVGSLPVATSPNFGARGSATSPARIAMRKSMPRGAKVQRAVQSMKSRSAERRPVKDLGDRLEVVAAGGARRPYDAGRDAGAERHADEGAGFKLEP